jgi:hypothetical protein
LAETSVIFDPFLKNLLNRVFQTAGVNQNTLGLCLCQTLQLIP